MYLNMYARSTLDHYADGLPEAERQPFKDAVATLRGTVHGSVEILLASDLQEAGLGKHVAKLEENQKWLYLTNTGDDLSTVYGLRFESRMC